MITFKQFLNEIFDKAYKFDIDNIDGDQGSIEYKLSFSAASGMYYVMIIYYKKNNIIRIDFSDEDGESTVTGLAGGDAFKIFATLSKILDTALIQHPNAAIQFEGYKSESSKIKLYDKLVSKIATKLHRTVKTKTVENGKNIRWIIQ